MFGVNFTISTTKHTTRICQIKLFSNKDNSVITISKRYNFQKYVQRKLHGTKRGELSVGLRDKTGSIDSG